MPVRRGDRDVSTCATCRHWRIDPEYPNARMRDCAAIGQEFGFTDDSTNEAREGREGGTGADMTPLRLAEAPAIIRPGDPLEGSLSTLRTTADFGCALYTIAAV